MQGSVISNFVGLESDGPINEFELSIIRNIIQALTMSGLNASSIGVITPFRSQVEKSLFRHLSPKFFQLSPNYLLLSSSVFSTKTCTSNSAKMMA